MTKRLLLVALFPFLMLFACQTVDVTKTGRGFFDPVDPDQVDILMTLPEQGFTEVATVSTTGWSPSSTAKMHNALRMKAGPLGADAVVLINSGVDANGKMWSTGVAIQFK